MYISFVTVWEECFVKEVGGVNKAKTISHSMDYLIRKQVI